jgi:hypothetical protein
MHKNICLWQRLQADIAARHIVYTTLYTICICKMLMILSVQYAFLYKVIKVLFTSSTLYGVVHYTVLLYIYTYFLYIF